MRRHSNPISVAMLLAALGATLLLACGPTTDGAGNGGSSDAGTEDPDASGAACTSNADCNGGVCVDGACCPSAEQVCGGVCCALSETCFANACVSPGDLCITTNDCDEGQYCEPALGPADQEIPTEPEEGCLYPPNPTGRCLDLPPDCDEPGLPPGTECIPECEYHPPVGGQLSAVKKWSWGPTADQYSNKTDVWSTPTVGRLYDANCDGVIDELDPPSLVFISGNVNNTCCHCDGSAVSNCLKGVVRVLDGLTGVEIWSLNKVDANSVGFAGTSPALGDLDGDGVMEIIAVTGEGRLAVLDNMGTVLAVSSDRIPGYDANAFGWGGGLAVADMNADGYPEIAYGATVFTYANGALGKIFTGTGGIGGKGYHAALSLFADLDGATDNTLELLAGNTAYKWDGSQLWYRSDLPDGFSAVADFDLNGVPEAVLVSGGKVWILAAATGSTLAGPLTIGGSGNGGAPTVADFDGDGKPEIGVAQQNYYSMMKPDLAGGTIEVVWQSPNHDLSSSITGSTVFDFEGDGAAEVIYNDECFLWVYDGATGAVRFAAPTSSFTGTEASLVADLDGDGHAEMLMISNGADPSASGWGCDKAPWNEPDPATNRPAWTPSPYGYAYRGITVFGDSANSWVGTRTLWNQHTYHVTNICDDRDSACDSPNTYGAIPRFEKKNWEQPWLNNFRQNVQDHGIFDAPDAMLSLNVDCTNPPVLHGWVKNNGAALLPAGVEVGFYVQRNGEDVLLGSDFTVAPVFPGQVAEVEYTVDASAEAIATEPYIARILIDPLNPTFHECQQDNNDSPVVRAQCVE